MLFPVDPMAILLNSLKETSVHNSTGFNGLCGFLRMKTCINKRCDSAAEVNNLLAKVQGCISNSSHSSAWHIRMQSLCVYHCFR